MVEKTQPTSNMAELFQSIASVSEAIKSLKPDKVNTHARYEYISSDEIYLKIGQAMAKEGLVVIPSVVSNSITTEIVNTGAGEKRRYDANVEFNLLLADEKGNTMSIPWRSMGIDYTSPDKALFCAMTTGMTYFLKMLFLVGKGNPDGEHQNPPTPTKGYPPDQVLLKASPVYEPPAAQANQPQSYAQPQAQASHNYAGKNMSPPVPDGPPPLVSPQQAETINGLLSPLKDRTEWDNWLQSQGWQSIKQIPAYMYADVTRFLQGKVAEQLQVDTPKIPVSVPQTSSANYLPIQAFFSAVSKAKIEGRKDKIDAVKAYLLSLGIASFKDVNAEQAQHATTILEER
jgi:hypothetical protein